MSQVRQEVVSNLRVYNPATLPSLSRSIHYEKSEFLLLFNVVKARPITHKDPT